MEYSDVWRKLGNGAAIKRDIDFFDDKLTRHLNMLELVLDNGRVAGLPHPVQNNIVGVIQNLASCINSAAFLLWIILAPIVNTSPTRMTGA